MHRIDLHVHTTASACSVLQPRALAALCVSMDLPVVVTTNHHDSYSDTNYLHRELESHGILYFPGMEITTRWGDFLLFGRDLAPFQGKHDRFPVELLPNPDIAVIWAHPYRLMSDVKVESIKWEVAEYIDAVEGINGNCLYNNRINNYKATDMAKEIGRPTVGGSDAHSDRMFFVAWTEFDEPVLEVSDLVGQIKSGSVKPASTRGV